MEKVKVLIVDDSALVRQILSEIFVNDSRIEVVGTASDPFVARNKIKELNPDVITLDVEMPKMDGVTFLRNLMRLRPTPVIMISSLTEHGADITLEALELGAIDFITKPKLDVAQGLAEFQEEIVEKVIQASKVPMSVLENASKTIKKAKPKLSADAVISTGARRHFKTTEKIIAVGASTGGTEAIKHLLIELPANAPGVVVTQHIPAAFSAPFAQRMNAASAMVVKEAQGGEVILPGHVLIAPGDRHLLVKRDGARYVCELIDGPPVNRHIPSVDVMFRSVSQNVGPNAIGVILTGMGDDGAAGMLEMKSAGAYTIAQDEKTSVVWGMPGAAVKAGGVDDVLPLGSISGHLLKHIEREAV